MLALASHNHSHFLYCIYLVFWEFHACMQCILSIFHISSSRWALPDPLPTRPSLPPSCLFYFLSASPIDSNCVAHLLADLPFSGAWFRAQPQIKGNLPPPENSSFLVRVGTHGHLSSPCWHADRLDLGAGLVQAAIAARFLGWSGAVAHRFRVVLPKLWLLSFSHVPLPRRSLGLGGRCDINGSLVAEHSTDTRSLHFDQLWVSAWTVIHSTKECLWWGLRVTRIYVYRVSWEGT